MLWFTPCFWEQVGVDLFCVFGNPKSHPMVHIICYTSLYQLSCLTCCRSNTLSLCSRLNIKPRVCLGASIGIGVISTVHSKVGARTNYWDCFRWNWGCQMATRRRTQHALVMTSDFLGAIPTNPFVFSHSISPISQAQARRSAPRYAAKSGRRSKEMKVLYKTKGTT